MFLQHVPIDDNVLGTTSFVSAFDARHKDLSAWTDLRERGLRRVYIGLETGDDDLLRRLDEHGVPLPEQTLARAREVDAILLGAVGGPKWDGDTYDKRPEAGLLRLRKDIELFANLRPAGPAAPPTWWR